jgi:hypothetical protein
MPLLSVLCLLTVKSIAQSGAVIPEGGAGHAAQASCVILKRMGPADQVTSRMYSFGIRGKQFQYVEGKLPEGFPFHGRLTDHDVRNLQGRGAEVIVIESHYTAEDLKQARADCRGETGKTPNQAEAKSALPKSSMDDTAESPAAPHSPAVVESKVKLLIASVPEGADIEVDGNFVGNAPSEVQVADGEHTVIVKKIGFKDWERQLKVSAGSNVRLDAELEKTATQ